MRAWLSTLAIFALAAAACDSSEGSDGDEGGGGAAADAGSGAPDADRDAPDGSLLAGCDFQPGMSSDIFAETIQLESADGSTCVKLLRRDDAEPGWIYKAHPFTLLSFRVDHGGEVALVEDEEALHWESSHHNWSDWGEALTANVRYRIESRYTATFDDRYELFSYDLQSEAVRYGPIELFPYRD